MLGAGRYNINSRRINAAVPEDAGKLGDILFYAPESYAVKHPREKVAQVMRKDLFWVDVCLPAQGFHLAPNVCAAYRFSRSRYKNHAVFNILLRRVTEQFCFSSFTIKTVRVLDLQLTTALPRFAASTVIYYSSLTLIPVAQIFCNIRLSLLFSYCVYAPRFCKAAYIQPLSVPFLRGKKSAAEVLET